MAKKKVIITVGKRKKAVARVRVKEGKGKITINSIPLENMQNRYNKMRIEETTMLASDIVDKIDISANVKGGGISGQTSAVRTAITKGLILWSKDKKLKEKISQYDKSMLVSDPRRTERHKPSASSKGSRTSKQQSKR